MTISARHLSNRESPKPEKSPMKIAILSRNPKLDSHTHLSMPVHAALSLRPSLDNIREV